MRKVRFLGVVIGLEKIKMEEEKIKSILEQLTPKGVKDIQKFLELANYYQWFIKDFVVIAKPLHDLVKKDQKQDWTERQEKIFKKLKEIFTKELVLTILDLDEKMRMEVNILDYMTGRVLSMEYKYGRQRLVAFLPKEIKRNYKIYDKEMLAVIKRLENWRHLLEGAKFKFEVQIDHKNLDYFMKVQKLNKK